MHKNIVSFKHKQYLDFLEYQKKKSEGDTVAPGTPKQQKGKGQTKPKETPKSSPKVEETKQTNSKGKSKLMEKYKDLLSSDSSGTDDEAPTNTKPPPAKAKVNKNEPKEVQKATTTATIERNGKKESRSRSTSSTKEIKSDVKIAAQSRSRSNSTDVKSMKSPTSKRRDSRKSSSESVGDKKVFQNPLWQNQEEKKVPMVFILFNGIGHLQLILISVIKELLSIKKSEGDQIYIKIL